MATLITPKNDQMEISPSGDRWTVEEIRKLLGGAAEPVYIGRGEVMFSNPSTTLPENVYATNIMIKRVVSFNDMLRGDVVLMKLGEEPT